MPATARKRRTGSKKSRVGKSKMVYAFGPRKTEGRGDWKELLGGKGANLADMTSIGLPVPPGFTITTEACATIRGPAVECPPAAWTRSAGT